MRQAQKVFRESYSALLPAHVVTRGFAALEGLLAVKVKPEKKADRMRWHRLMQEAHYFQNALHNYAIGFEQGLPTGTESAGGAPALVVFSQAENVILFPGRAGAGRTAFDDLFGDGDRDR